VRDVVDQEVTPERAASGIPSALATLGQRRRVAAGTILFQQKTPAESCFLLEDGEIALRRLSLAGDEVEIARLGGGDWFGEIVLFADRAYPAQAIAVQESNVLEFHRSSVLACGDPSVFSYFLGLLARKCLFLNRRIEQLTIMDTRERLARYIVGLCPGRQAGCDGGKVACSVPLPKKKREIAAELGMAPETLSRTLRQMQDEGYVKVIGSRVDVPSCVKLQSLIQD
jgi:CRP/FNR family transcriptional regulator, dissimilatory nitrate respiration regulator